MNPAANHVVVCGGFDDLRSRHVRFLEEAAKFGDLTVLLWNDAALRRQTGTPPKFSEAERLYVLSAIRFVRRVILCDAPANVNVLPTTDGLHPQVWVVESAQANAAKRKFCEANGLELRALTGEALRGFPDIPPAATPPGRKKVIVTGCYDWFHSGHVRFFEEVSAYGDLYACVGNDANVRHLKGAHHPMHSQDERRYLVGAVRFVKQALITSGEGWLDAEPEIQRLKPDIYAVNEDGDRGGKREFCAKHGIEYLVLKRTPAPGLPQRTSTDLRGF
jgi:cytidyltransferase-like protein